MSPASNPVSGKQYSRLVIRNAMLINGRGTPAEGPVDMVVERDTIKSIIDVDPVTLSRRPSGWKRPEGDFVIDATGMFVIPGLVDMHAHIPIDDSRSGPRGFEYAYKLWLGCGITTLRTCGWGGDEKLLEHRRLGEENKMDVPRLVVLRGWPRDETFAPNDARKLVHKYKEEGFDGIKMIPQPRDSIDMIAAICDEAKKLNMKGGVVVHLPVCTDIDALMASKAGVGSIEHWYGIPDAALPGTQHFPPEYNYLNELHRFRWAGRLWEEADKYSEKIIEVLDLLIKNGTIWDPTMVVYEANRDLGRAMTLPWHGRFTAPSLMDYWSPNPAHHASYHFDWKTSDEIAWKEHIRIWMKYVRMFFERGGTVTVGSDAGSLYALYGFSTIRELELLQEAGFHPIDVIKIATTNAAKSLGLRNLEGGLREGHTADLVIIDGNPLDNFKVMYGKGTETSTDNADVPRHGGVKWTVKSGIVFDAQALLRDVEDYVREMRK